jgi:hypothetical protein
MKFLLPSLLAVIAFSLAASAQSVPAPGEMAQAKPPPPPDDTSSVPEPAAPPTQSKNAHLTPAETAALIDRLTRSNADLFDILKKQQDVLSDIEYDRRLQDRQLMLLEARMVDTLHANTDLQKKIAALEAAPAAAPAVTPSVDVAATETHAPPVTVAAPAPPPPPVSVLPPEETAGAPGTMWWHRLLALSGDDSKNSTTFHVSGRQWRVLWHNQDPPGETFKNTSALFINAFPTNDTIPKRVCSQLGTGGDSTELKGSGDYYLKIEASGGHWELAVEDFR